MNLQQLTQAVLDTVQDPSVDGTTTVRPLLNRGLFLVATLLDLPNLITNTTLTTVVDNYRIDLPSDFHKKMFFVGCSTPGYEREVKTWHDKHSLKALLRRFPGLSEKGDIEYYAVQGTSKFYYHPIPPTPTNLNVFYYRVPVSMTDDNDEPDGLPAIDACQYVLVHYACWQLFSSIEDGMEGQKVNTMYHKAQFGECLGMIRDFVGQDEVAFNLEDESWDWIP